MSLGRIFANFANFPNLIKFSTLRQPKILQRKIFFTTFVVL